VNELPADSASEADRGGPAIVIAALAQIPRARQHVAEAGSGAGLPSSAVERLAIATHEVVTNAIMYGGGRATIRIDIDDTRLVVTVADRGTGWSGSAPAARPAAEQLGGRGLWLADNLCDEMTIARTPTGTTIRLVMILPRDGPNRVAAQTVTR
jgi:anti-sigma regulatory factor (Ser/Thr protein kinase)